MKFNTQLSIFEEIRDKSNQLRFDTRCIKISDIASQFYCEKKLELRYLHGEVDNIEKLFGREEHDELAQEGVKIEIQKGWEQIFTAHRLFLSESLFFAKYKDICLAFKPDRVLFVDGSPRLLIEFKFSRYSIPFDSYHVQLQTEGYLFKKLGFDVSRLYYLIIIAPTNIKPDSKYLSDIPKRVFEKIQPHIIEEHFIFKDINAYLYKFNTKTAKKNFKWALEYWKYEREAKLADNKNKCRSCEYKKPCAKK